MGAVAANLDSFTPQRVSRCFGGHTSHWAIVVLPPSALSAFHTSKSPIFARDDVERACSARAT
jgi:hypothetical protein